MREIKRPGELSQDLAEQQMEQQRQRAQPGRSRHAARPGRQAPRVSVGSRCLQGARGALLTPGPAQLPQQPA